MIFKGIELHNVAELEKNLSGYDMLRVPKSTESGLNETAQIRNRLSTGIELRFVHIDDEVKIAIKTDVANGVSMPMLYYGNIQCGWQEAGKTIYDSYTEIVIKRPQNLDYLKRIAREFNHPFDPEVIRLVMPVRKCSIIDVIGRCCPPNAEQLPKKRYLAYGSSITHGSESIIPAGSYAFRVAESLGADLINLGYAGSAAMEACMADYIAQRDDWDFATLEMGINVIHTLDEDEFRSRVQYFVNKIASENPDKKIVCIDLFYHHLDYENNPKTEIFRSIVKEIAETCGYDNVYHINGKDIISGMNWFTADLEHPNVRGMEEIAVNLTCRLKEILV